MKIWIPLLTLTTAVSLTSCNLDQRDQRDHEDNGKYCLAYSPYNVASMLFQHSLIDGKQYTFKAEGRVVYDSCNGGTQMPAGNEGFYEVYNNSALASLSHMINRGDALPSGETVELLTRAQCTDALTSVGTAVVTHTYQHQASSNPDCKYDYELATQMVTFQ